MNTKNMKLKNFQLKNEDGAEIDIDCRFIPRAQKAPVVIFCHGFKGFKDWGGFPFMMEKLANDGYFAVSFNFSFNGIAKNTPHEFSRLDLFAKNTFSRELDETGKVIDYIFSNAEEYGIDSERIALIGHSRGGGIAIIKTSEDKRVKTLVTLASVSNFDRYSEEHKRKWKEKGYFEVENTRTHQMMRLNSTLLDDITDNAERLNILRAVGEINIPFLIIHGKEDLSVKSSEATEIYEASGSKNTEIFIVERTGHTFGTVEPFKGTTKAFETVIDKMGSFLKEKL